MYVVCVSASSYWFERRRCSTSTFVPRSSALCASRYALAMSRGAPLVGPVRNLIGDAVDVAVAAAVAVSRPPR